MGMGRSSTAKDVFSDTTFLSRPNYRWLAVTHLCIPMVRLSEAGLSTKMVRIEFMPTLDDDIRITSSVFASVFTIVP